MNIAIINGPNLNLLGKREPEVYGSLSFEQYFEQLQEQFPQVQFHYFQSNSEGDLIDHLQQVGFEADGIILNGAGYTHTSIALRDAIAGISSPVVEVHISNIHAREDFRQHSYTAAKAVGVITGLGLQGYALATQYFLNRR
jgi:3-dehydroquinate dehydratase-2